MSWLSRILGYVSAEERRGISLKPPFWKAGPVRDLTIFLRALIHFVPSGSILYLEGGTPTKEILAFLENHTAEKTQKLALGTIWPIPKIFHVPITQENLESLAKLTEKRATPEAAIHLHVYKGDKILLEWYDAFFDYPFYITKEIPEEKVKDFCDKLNTKYEDATENV